MDLYVLSYNNYYNRILKRESSLAAYLNGRTYFKTNAANFNRNDDIMTTHVINFPQEYGEFEGNYLIVAEDQTIISRWFIVENQYVRRSQLNLTLRRDLLADYYSEYSGSPFFCEKGLVNYNDPYIFAQEEGDYNEIKTYEFSLDVGVGGPWIVLYFSQMIRDEWAPEKGGSRRTQYPFLAPDAINLWNLYVWEEATPYQRITTDAPYQVVIIPAFNGIFYNIPSGNTPGELKTYTSSMEKALAIATGISDMFGSGTQETGQTTSLIDIQILPYCTITYFSKDSRGRIIYTGPQIPELEAAQTGPFRAMDIKGDTSGFVGQIYFCDRSIFELSKTITYPYMAVNQTKALTEAVKEDSNLRFVRLCSNNGGAIFQYNQAKIADLSSIANARKMEFTIKCNYKPISPQIQIYPEFSGLYGQTFSKDQRGIFFQGDYSIPLNTNAFLQYAVQNKNFQQIFDRQIQNMERTFSINQKRTAIAGAVGIANAGVQGAASGSLIGGPVGAIAGGILSAGSSAVGLGLDLKYNKMLQAEAVDYTKDQFASQLGNIKALPNTMSNVGTYGSSSKVFPYIEVYSCTSKELTAFRNKLTYNGFSIGRTGTFAEFEANARNVYTSYDTKYVKGQLIRCEALEGDSHLLTEIANELNKGVFIA